MDIRIKTTVDITPDDTMTSEQKVALLEFCIGEMNTTKCGRGFCKASISAILWMPLNDPRRMGVAVRPSPA